MILRIHKLIPTAAIRQLGLCHLFFSAATIAAFPAALSFRLGLGVWVGFAPSPAFFAAHLLRCASAMARRPAALIFRLPAFAGAGDSGVWAGCFGVTGCNAPPPAARECL